jgi:Xaa-Pro aminopeptidase
MSRSSLRRLDRRVAAGHDRLGHLEVTPLTTRVERLQEAMRAAGVDLAVVGPGADMIYLTDAHPHPDERLCLLLVGREGLAFVMPVLNADEVRTQTALPFHTHADEDGPDEALRTALRDVGADDAGEVAVEDAMRTDFTLAVQGALPNARTRLLGSLLGPIRARKDADEIEILRRNASQADDAIRAVAAVARAGMTEAELAHVAQERFRSLGARPTFAIVGSGPNGAFPHHATGSRRLEPGDAVVVDVGATYDSYASDITRMFVVGEPSARYLQVHAVVERAVAAALAVVAPGVRARDVDRAARQVIEEAGFGAQFVHRTGHGIGMTGHEPPYLTATSDVVLEAGMTHSVEPGIYLPGEFGVRLEEIVAVTAAGCVILSTLPRDPIVVPAIAAA